MKRNMQSTLQSVGVLWHYCGYPYFVLSVAIAAENPNRLQNIRTVRDIIMCNDGAALLEKMTGSACWKKRTPYPKEIIGIFAEYFADELKKEISLPSRLS